MISNLYLTAAVVLFIIGNILLNRILKDWTTTDRCVGVFYVTMVAFYVLSLVHLHLAVYEIKMGP